jgi:hypothetical protein
MRREYDMTRTIEAQCFSERFLELIRARSSDRDRESESRADGGIAKWEWKWEWEKGKAESIPPFPPDS